MGGKFLFLLLFLFIYFYTVNFFNWDIVIPLDRKAHAMIRRVRGAEL
jgi:hypothetical protein